MDRSSPIKGILKSNSPSKLNLIGGSETQSPDHVRIKLDNDPTDRKASTNIKGVINPYIPEIMRNIRIQENKREKAQMSIQLSKQK